MQPRFWTRIKTAYSVFGGAEKFPPRFSSVTSNPAHYIVNWRKGLGARGSRGVPLDAELHGPQFQRNERGAEKMICSSNRRSKLGGQNLDWPSLRCSVNGTHRIITHYGSLERAHRELSGKKKYASLRQFGAEETGNKWVCAVLPLLTPFSDHVSDRSYKTFHWVVGFQFWKRHRDQHFTEQLMSQACKNFCPSLPRPYRGPPLNVRWAGCFA